MGLCCIAPELEFSAIEEEPEEFRYALHVKVDSARDLIGANKNGNAHTSPFCGRSSPLSDHYAGTSDPYCKLSLGEQRVKTRCVRRPSAAQHAFLSKATYNHGECRYVSNSVNPEWHEAFSFSVSDPEVETLLIEVIDHEKVGNNKPLVRHLSPLPKVLQDFR